MIQIGIRSPVQQEVFDWTLAKGVTILDAEDVHERTPKDIAQAIAEVVGDGPTYLSFDIDALDPAFAPGTGTPEIGGLSTWQARAILRRLEEIDFIGMDMVEVAPAYDTAEITALAAATLVWEISRSSPRRGERGDGRDPSPVEREKVALAQRGSDEGSCGLVRRWAGRA